MPDARRRIPGLRREEVAVLANVGVSWYTWLEQGRDIKVSASILDAIVGALRLNDAQRAHLYLLAGRDYPEASDTEPRADTLETIVDEFQSFPAYVINSHWLVTAANRCAKETIDIRSGTNCMIRFFTEPGRADCYVDKTNAAKYFVGGYRLQSAKYPDDPIFYQTAAALSSESELFARLWNDYTVCAEMPNVLGYRYDDLGILVFRPLALKIPSRTDLRLVLHLPIPTGDTFEAHLHGSPSLPGSVLV